MNKEELLRYESASLVIEKDRVLTFSNISCPLGCRYCFANEIVRHFQDNKGAYLSEEQFQLLEQLPPDITSIMLGCDTEFLQNKTQALRTMVRLSTIGKDLSVITKLSLDDELIASLARINSTMKANGSFLLFSVSLACTDSKNTWEPGVSSVAARAMTLRKATCAGIDTMVAIRPLIPTVARCELDEIVDMTKDYTFGYYSGPLYLKELDDSIITTAELDALGCVVSKEAEDVKWMPDGNKFLRIDTPDLLAYLKDKVEHSGRILFEGAADGMNYLRRCKYAQHRNKGHCI